MVSLVTDKVLELFLETVLLGLLTGFFFKVGELGTLAGIVLTESFGEEVFFNRLPWSLFTVIGFTGFFSVEPGREVAFLVKAVEVIVGVGFFKAGFLIVVILVVGLTIGVRIFEDFLTIVAGVVLREDLVVNVVATFAGSRVVGV